MEILSADIQADLAAAQTRAAAALATRTAPQPVDIKALRAEFEAMLHWQGNG